MCGRYIFISEEDELRELLYLASFASGIELAPEDYPNGDIVPGDMVPVITGWTPADVDKRKDDLRAEFAVWGMPLAKRKSTVINSRRERIIESPMFSRLLDTGRCIIPASGYYEWKHYTEAVEPDISQLSLFGDTNNEKKTVEKSEKYIFTLPDTKVMYMAGLSEKYPDGLRFTIITGDSVGRAKDVHDRMPLILTPINARLWLNDRKMANEILSGDIPVPDMRLAE